MALVTPLLLALLFGSVELGNFFLSEHALAKQVRDGARFAARLPLKDTYNCSADPTTVFADADASTQIVNVTETGAVSGTGFPRWTPAYWNRTCGTETATVTVTIRCVPKADIDTEDNGFTGLYTALDGDIPVAKVAGRVRYQSVLSALGFTGATNICLRADSEAAVQGI
jgi:Flp pilus assembly protein TadG